MDINELLDNLENEHIGYGSPTEARADVDAEVKRMQDELLKIKEKLLLSEVIDRDPGPWADAKTIDEKLDLLERANFAFGRDTVEPEYINRKRARAIVDKEVKSVQEKLNYETMMLNFTVDTWQQEKQASALTIKALNDKISDLEREIAYVKNSPAF
jgi:hypothetical protein